jgi:DNA-binding XRE family transcriptional regulator
MRNLISERLKEKGKTQSWLAQRCGLSTVYINKVIKGKVDRPAVQTAYKIAHALGDFIEHIFIFTDGNSDS